MATKKAKPNGQYHLRAGHVLDYFATIKTADLPGVGHSTLHKLRQLNLLTCVDLRAVPLARLQHEFGRKFGETLHQHARGLDTKPLVFDHVRRTVSAEINYGIRFQNDTELVQFLRQLCAEVHGRLMASRRKGKAITLKYMVRAADAPVETAKYMGHGVCDNVTKTITLPGYTNDLGVIEQSVMDIRLALATDPAELRGIGIQIAKLNGADEMAAAAKQGGGQQQQNALKTMFGRVEERRMKATAAKDPRMQPNEKTPVKCAQLDELDADVLAALPDDIRAEVLRDYGILNKTLARSVAVKPRSLNEEFKGIDDEENRPLLNVSASSMASSSSCQVPAIPSVSVENVLVWPEWRRTLHEWMDSCDGSPENCDVEIIVGYAVELVRARRLEDLYLRMRFFYRFKNDFLCIYCLSNYYFVFIFRVMQEESGLCAWHLTYRKIYEKVQAEMLVVYDGKRLLLTDKFNCSNC